MRVGILAVQGDFDAHARVLQRLRCDYRLVRQPEELDGLDALILPGGESTAMLKLLEPEAFRDRLQAFVREHAVLGTCAGAILMAQRVTDPAQDSLGLLDVTAARNAYGRQIDSSIRRARVSPEFVPGLGEELETVLIRAPRFRDLGPGVRVAAAVDGEPVLLTQGHVVAASFHPELGHEDKVHRWFLDRVGSGLQSG